MPAIKKTKLYSSLWASCDELRGGMDASQYKDYILTLLFVKYVSDKYKGIDGDIEVPEGGSFDDIIALKGNKEIGEKIDKIIAKLAAANDLREIIDNAKFNDVTKLGQGKEKVDKLTNIIGIFQSSGLDFKNNRADGDDIIGDAYEYLMRHFATESGKSKGSFYTPAEVSRVLAKIIGIGDVSPTSDITVYDPACGSGSLLIKVADESPNADKVAIYGQEKDITTAGLAKMNFVLHKFTTGVVKGNYSTFSDPQYFERDGADKELKRFDFVVANPPFSTKNWTNGYKDFGRIEGAGYVTPPKKNGDYAWLLHIIKSMKATKGKAAVILPHGVLFRGNAEADIRKVLVDKGLIKGIIGLPSNLFYGTGIPACVILLDKEGAGTRKGIFMIDASRGFVKDGNKNRLRERDIYKIVKHFLQQIDEDKYSRFVLLDEVKTKNGYNLNIPCYIDASEPEDIQNIDGHLNGGIPSSAVDALKKYWDLFSGLKEKLFSHLREGFYKLNIPKDSVRQTVYADKEFMAYADNVDKAFENWQNFARQKLLAINPKTQAKVLISDLAEKLINEYKDISLIDKYDVYEVLLSYWQEVMADDIYVIIKDGYLAAREVDVEVEEKKTTDKKTGEEKLTRKEKGWDGKIIPKDIIAKAFFKKELDAVAEIEAIIEATQSKLDELADEHGGDEGALSECKTDKGAISIESVKKAIKSKETDEDDLVVLKEYASNYELLKAKEKLAKDMSKLLWGNVRAKYPLLLEGEIKDLVLNKKWFTTVQDGIEVLYTAISSRIANRIATLAERYDETLPVLEQRVDELEDKVKSHLKRMGFVW